MISGDYEYWKAVAVSRITTFLYHAYEDLNSFLFWYIKFARIFLLLNHSYTKLLSIVN